MICVACNKEFESKNNETICPVCFQRILRDIQKPKNGTCPICGIPSKRYKYCSNRCYNIAHSVLARKYYKAHSEEILKKQKAGRMRKYKHGDRMDAIERIGRSIHMSYGMTRALLQRRAARDGISLDMVIAIVQQERRI
ncbi:hypothetical protein ACT01_08715 [Megasphaera hexanoica]|nr:hypothetical protein ACT01_08715 [Megasphaera hexanoica]